MSFLTVDLNNVDLSAPEVLKFVLADEITVPTYSREPVLSGYKKVAVRPDIEARLEDGTAAVQTLYAVKRHNYEVLKNRVVETSVYADEIFSQNVSIRFRPCLFVKDNTSDDLTSKIINVFDAFDPQAGIDPEDYAKDQSVVLGVPVDTARIVGALVFVRQGARTPDKSQIDGLKEVYKDNGVRAYPIFNNNDGVHLDLASDGYSLREVIVDDLDYLPQPVRSPNKIVIPKGDQVAEELAVNGVAERLKLRFSEMDCGAEFNQQKWKVASTTVYVESKIEWEVREIRGDCFRIEVRVPVLKFRNVDLVLYVLTINPIVVVASALEKTIACAINSALNVRVIGVAMINIVAAIAAFGTLFEACMRYHETSLLCVIPDLALVTEVESQWH